MQIPSAYEEAKDHLATPEDLSGNLYYFNSISEKLLSWSILIYVVTFNTLHYFHLFTPISLTNIGGNKNIQAKIEIFIFYGKGLLVLVTLGLPNGNFSPPKDQLNLFGFQLFFVSNSLNSYF